MISNTFNATEVDKKLPPNVDPCVPGVRISLACPFSRHSPMVTHFPSYDGIPWHIDSGVYHSGVNSRSWRRSSKWYVRNARFCSGLMSGMHVHHEHRTDG